MKTALLWNRFAIQFAFLLASKNPTQVAPNEARIRFYISRGVMFLNQVIDLSNPRDDL
jgi:hypothetical protein